MLARHLLFAYGKNRFSSDMAHIETMQFINIEA